MDISSFEKGSILQKIAKKVDKDKSFERQGDAVLGDEKLTGNEISVFDDKVHELSNQYPGLKYSYESQLGVKFDAQKLDVKTKLDSNASNSENILIKDDGVSVTISDKYFNQNGSRVVTNKPIEGVITLKDSNGNTQQMPLIINDQMLNHLYAGKEYIDKNILSKLKQAIDELPEETKTDLFNEVNRIEISEVDVHKFIAKGLSKGTQGAFTKKDSVIFLYIKPASYDKGELEDKNGITSTYLAHEIGHALDEFGGVFSSEDSEISSLFKANFEILKTVVSNKFDLSKYLDSQKYFLKEPEEFISEYFAYNNRLELQKKYIQQGRISSVKDLYRLNIAHESGNERYKLMDELAKSNDPQIRKVFDSLSDKYKIIINKSRMASPQKRKAPDAVNIIEKFKSINLMHTDELYEKYTNLQASSDKDIYELFSRRTEDFAMLYYQYLQGDTSNEKFNKIFDQLPTNKEHSGDWAVVSKYLEQFMEEYGIKIKR